jgi:competence protein ComEC
MIGFLMFNPFMLYNSGFQLSFLISFSIILGNNLIRTESKLLKVTKIGVLSTLVSLPIVLKLNGSFGVMNIIYNVGFVYFVTLIFLPASFLSALFVDLEGVYLQIIEVFERLVDFAFRSNYYLSFQFSSEVTVILYWVALLSLLILYKTKYRKILIMAVLMVLVVNFVNNVFSLSTYVRMLDVNQAEAIHIHSGSCDILIDTGDTDDYDSVLNYFKKINVSELDYLILTHQHQDHFGEALDLIENLRVGNIIVSGYYEDLSAYSQYLLLENQKLSCENVVIYNLNSGLQENENNNSLVLLTLIGNDKWLFTGDIEADKEKEIISKYDFDLDVLKIAHHGSMTSTTSDFLKKTKPEYGLISAGDSGYDHPSDIVIDRLEQYNVKYFSTKTEGTITFYYPLNFHWAIIETKEFDSKPKYQIKT